MFYNHFDSYNNNMIIQQNNDNKQSYMTATAPLKALPLLIILIIAPQCNCICNIYSIVNFNLQFHHWNVFVCCFCKLYILPKTFVADIIYEMIRIVLVKHICVDMNIFWRLYDIYFTVTQKVDFKLLYLSQELAFYR